MPPRLPNCPLSASFPRRALRAGAPVRNAFFSTTQPARKRTKHREDMFQWLAAEGRQFEDAKKPAYAGPVADQPFPLNPFFKSQPVLDEDARELIWSRIVQDKEPAKVVSADMGVDIRRVLAVVRLKQLEKQFEAQGKPLARPYSKAILAMLPKTSYPTDRSTWFKNGTLAIAAHEPINDIPIHSRTKQQLFIPTSESRHFTREDAAKAFSEHMLPADSRSLQPELIRMEREMSMLNPEGSKFGRDQETIWGQFRGEAEAAEKALEARKANEAARQEAKIHRVQTDRFELRFKDINAEQVGADGRSRRGVGWRYGMQFPDRKKGFSRIPTKAPY